MNLEFDDPKIQGVSVTVLPRASGGVEVRARLAVYSVEVISEDVLMHAREGALSIILSEMANRAARAVVRHAALVISPHVRRRELIRLGLSLQWEGKRGEVVKIERRGDVSRCTVRWWSGGETEHAIEDVIDGIEVGAWTVD